MDHPIPYGRHEIDENDIHEVIKALRSDFLTTGPKVKEFEEKFSNYVGAKYAVAVSSGTAALHLACLAAGLKKDEEIITSPITFAASANCALYCNAKPVFVDVNEQGLIDKNKIKEKITEKTRIILPVHYAGLTADMEGIKQIADQCNLIIIEDACHALGAKYKNLMVGGCNYSDMAVFSFHPVKHITTGEGGMITTNSKELYERILLLRSHGITKEKEKFKEKTTNGWHYEMQDLGYNYRISDFQCALGASQLNKANEYITKRREIARKYDRNLNSSITLIKENQYQFSSYHLYPILLNDEKARLELFNYLKEKQIFCQVHYIPVYWHPYYQKLGYQKGACPKAEEFYKRVLSIPIYPRLGNQQDRVIQEINNFFTKKDNKIGIIIQARMSSTRLPNKVMQDLGGKPILWHTVERCKKANADIVIVATSTNKENDIIEEFCMKNNYPCFRGSEDDVLDRYYQAAKKFGLKTIIRITSDCPLIEPEVINVGIEKYAMENVDYISNVHTRSFPRGFDVEIFSFKTLEKCHALAAEKAHREHVTPFIYNNPELFSIKEIVAEGALEKFKRPYLRLTIDTEEDLRLLRNLYNQFYFVSNNDVISFLDQNPALLESSLAYEQKHRNQVEQQNIKQAFVK